MGEERHKQAKAPGKQMQLIHRWGRVGWVEKDAQADCVGPGTQTKTGLRLDAAVGG